MICNKTFKLTIDTYKIYTCSFCHLVISDLVRDAGRVLDLGRLEARRGEEVVNLTPREAGIVRWLHRQRNRAVSRSELLERVWGSSGDLETRTVDMTIANLRQKIERDPSQPRIVVTVTGAGYAWGDQ